MEPESSTSHIVEQTRFPTSIVLLLLTLGNLGNILKFGGHGGSSLFVSPIQFKINKVIARKVADDVCVGRFPVSRGGCVRGFGRCQQAMIS